MLFSSMTFVFLFLPIVCTVYLLAKPSIRNYVLLIASIIFYAWGEPRYLAIMILTILVNYYGALAISKWRSNAKLLLGLTIIVDLSFLAYFKYFNFAVDNINALMAMDIKFIDVIMPIGISFYTFQAMSYLIDVYREDAKVQKDIYKLALYIVLFPQLVAGPIVKYHDIAGQIDQRKVSFDKVSYGVKRFIIGLSKKMLIANTLGAMVDRIFSLQVNQFDTFTAWLGAIGYSLQLYYDFSGYSDMAIGLGMIFGFRFLENFNYPYISKSITEFWRRWHISLSTWFKQYLYFPLGGNRISKGRTYFNLGIVFMATGIWHGAEWTFFFWGLWHGFFIIIEKITGWNRDGCGKIREAIRHLYCIGVFVFGWVIFRAPNMAYAYDYMRHMLGAFGPIRPAFQTAYYLDNLEIIMLGIGVACSMPLFRNVLEIGQEFKIRRGLVNVALLLLMVLSSAAIAASTYNPFIYFRF